MKWGLFILWGCFTFQIGFGQKVYFCESRPDEGIPSDTSHQWRMRPNGGYIYLKFVQSQEFKVPKLDILVEFEQDSTWLPVDSLPFFVKETETQAVYHWWVKDKGKYQISIVHPETGELAKDTLRIRNSLLEKSTAQFRNTHLVFCDSAVKEQPFNPGGTFSFQPEGRKLIALLTNSVSLSLRQVKVDIWRKEFENWEIFHSYNYNLLPHWKFTQIPLNFPQPGNFRVEIYSPDGVWVNGGTVTVH